ncbi:MAG TPA: hypothetical protein GX396_06530 [Tissierellia bacterium]|nr:hypothetical protein [Tissierellia bacterium]
MRITIISESGDWKERLYTKDKVTYEVRNPEILDFFAQLSEAYNNNETMEDMFECLYNLINYGYLYTDDDYEDYDFYDYDEDYYELEDEESLSYHNGFKLIETEVEYFVDEEMVTKEEYDLAWDERLGYMGSSHWEDKGITIINADTDEIIFLGKMT